MLSLSWLSAVTAGHTKRVTVNAIMLSAYCIGNAAGPFIWQEKYRPRNHVPWIIIGICYVVCMSIMLLIRYLLNKENKKRDREREERVARGERLDEDEDVYIERVSDEGVKEKVKVDKVRGRCLLGLYCRNGFANDGF